MTESTFEKPITVTVDALSYLSEVLKSGLKKDLQKHQKLCDDCGGVGLEITNQRYGLSNDPDKYKHLPYDNQYIISCRHCHSGVVNLCEFCNKKLPTFRRECDCPQAHSKFESIRLEKESELWDKAIKLEPSDDIASNMGMYYSEDYPYNEGYFSEFCEFFDAWDDGNDPDVPKPIYVWGTTSTKLFLDAEDILEDQSQDLFEDALDHVKDKEELQKFLTTWSEKQTGTTTYYSENKYAIKIPWKDYIETK